MKNSFSVEDDTDDKSDKGGTGDHTWNGLEIMTPEQYDDYQKSNGIKSDDTHTITFGIENTKK